MSNTTKKGEAAFQRPMLPAVLARLREPRRFLQVLTGPRQVGKTTLARQVAAEIGIPVRYVTADEPDLRDRTWLAQQWDAARAALGAAGDESPALLVVDEIQKVGGWSETVKRLWEEDTTSGLPLKVLLLGSSRLLVERGLTESLAGRFELTHVPHWSFPEMRAAFGFTVERYVYFGGYPGAAPLTGDEPRWRRYVLDSLVETTLSRDILLLTRVDKPALLRRLFALGCEYSGQVLSFTKMLGQLQDAGNTVTLAHYLELLRSAGLLAGLEKYAGQAVRRRASSPKLAVLNTALATAFADSTFDGAASDPERWGRLVESAVGAHLLNSTAGTSIGVHYWLDRNREVDFVLASGKRLVAIEVKSGRRRTAFPGLAAFEQAFPVKRRLLIGGDGIPLAEFLSEPAARWLD